MADLMQLATWINAAEITRLRERARDASRSPRAFPILGVLVFAARTAPPDLDGRAAPTTRKAILAWLEIFCLRPSGEALRKLLRTLQAARLVEVSGSQVRATRLLLDDLASIGVRNATPPANSSGVKVDSSIPSGGQSPPEAFGGMAHLSRSSGSLGSREELASLRQEALALLDKLDRPA